MLVIYMKKAYLNREWFTKTLVGLQNNLVQLSANLSLVGWKCNSLLSLVAITTTRNNMSHFQNYIEVILPSVVCGVCASRHYDGLLLLREDTLCASINAMMTNKWWVNSLPLTISKTWALPWLEECITEYLYLLWYNSPKLDSASIRGLQMSMNPAAVCWRQREGHTNRDTTYADLTKSFRSLEPKTPYVSIESLDFG